MVNKIQWNIGRTTSEYAYADEYNPDALYIEVPPVITPGSIVYMNAMLDSAQIWAYSYHTIWSTIFSSKVPRLHVMRYDDSNNSLSTNIIRTVIFSYQ